jgi:hypothetical protein
MVLGRTGNYLIGSALGDGRLPRSPLREEPPGGDILWPATGMNKPLAQIRNALMGKEFNHVDHETIPYSD